MSQHLFLLGKASDLCFSELEAIFSYQNQQISRLSDKFVITEEEINPEKLINTLGGTVKIAKIIATNPIDEANIIASDLEKSTQRPNFSIVGMDSSTSFHIKNLLKEKNISSRYTFLEDIYKTATSQQKNYFEYWKIMEGDHTYIAKAIAFQNIYDWNKRDYDRPKVDPKSGMLPPKIARIMINLSTSPYKKSTIYDPFCGSGTILMKYF